MFVVGKRMFFSVTHDSGNAYMLAFPSVRLPSVRSIEISASRPARDFKFFLFDSSQGLGLPICKKFLVGPPGGGGWAKKGVFPYKIQSMACDISKYNEIRRRIRWCTSEEQLDQFFFFFYFIYLFFFFEI